MKNILFVLPVVRFDGVEGSIIIAALARATSTPPDMLLKSVAHVRETGGHRIEFRLTGEQFATFLIERSDHGGKNLFSELHPIVEEAIDDERRGQRLDLTGGAETWRDPTKGMPVDHPMCRTPNWRPGPAWNHPEWLRRVEEGKRSYGYRFGWESFKNAFAAGGAYTYRRVGETYSDTLRRLMETPPEFTIEESKWVPGEKEQAKSRLYRDRTTGKEFLYGGGHASGKTVLQWDMIRDAVERGENVLVAKPGGGWVSFKHEENVAGFQHVVFPDLSEIKRLQAECRAKDEVLGHARARLAEFEQLQKRLTEVSDNHRDNMHTAERNLLNAKNELDDARSCIRGLNLEILEQEKRIEDMKKSIVWFEINRLQDKVGKLYGLLKRGIYRADVVVHRSESWIERQKWQGRPVIDKISPQMQDLKDWSNEAKHV